jgi:GDP-L-fucose synthase
MKNVIVTGGTGFIGKAVVRQIAARFPGADVMALGTGTVDLAEKLQLFDWMDRQQKTFPCDHIIHLAALYKAGDWPVHHPATQFHVNMSINVNILEGWKRFFPKAKFTSILSYCMYPSLPHPHPESELWGHEPEDYLFAYAMTKKALLIGQRAYRQEERLASTSVVLPTVYGPGDSFAENSHVVGALVGKFVRAVRSGAETVEVWGNGEQEREFLLVDDAADGIVLAAERSDAEALNLGVGEAYRIGDIANWISAAAGFKGRIQYNENRFVGVKKRMLDVTRVREVLGWHAATPIEVGLKKTVAWYAANLEQKKTA